MKRIITLLLLVICSLNSTYAQHFSLQTREIQTKNGGKYVEVLNNPKRNPMSCSWRDVDVPCTLSLGHYTNANNQADEYCYLMLELEHKDLNEKIGSIAGVDIILTNGEKLDFLNGLTSPIYDYEGDTLTILLNAWSATDNWGGDDCGYRSTYRRSEMLETPTTASVYLFNQLSLYDIETIAINGRRRFKPQFKSAELIEAYVDGLHNVLPQIKGLPDLLNLDRSWTRKPVETFLTDLKGGGYKAQWDVPLAILKDLKEGDEEIDFWFAIEKNATDEVPRLLFLCDGYEKPERKSSIVSISITLSNGAKYQVLMAQMDVDHAYDVSMSAKLSSFYQNELSNKLHPKTLLQQLAKYDIVEVTMAENKYDLRNADASSADAFTRMCKALLEKTGDADLYALNTPAAAARPTATPKPAAKPAQPAVRPTQPTPKPTPKPAPQTTKSEAERIAEADRRAVELMTQGQTQQTQKPTQPSTGESGGFLLKAQGKLKYSRHISRKDHIAPREMVHTPLALFTSRAIPLDVVVELVDGAKGVGKVQSSTSSDGKQKSVSVRPSEFYCRVSGFEEVPCALMSVGYDAANTEQIKTSSFTYNLPSSWKRSKVKEYAKAFAEDLARLGVGWSESKDRYIGSYEGHYLMLDYGANGQDNHIYLYISYAEK